MLCTPPQKVAIQLQVSVTTLNYWEHCPIMFTTLHVLIKGSEEGDVDNRYSSLPHDEPLTILKLHLAHLLCPAVLKKDSFFSPATLV